MAEQKQRIVEETRAPGASVSVVAKRYDINANLLFKWKRQTEAVEPGMSPGEPPEFVPIGVVGRSGDGGPALLAQMPDAEHRAQGSGWPESELHRRAGLECRPGVIEIDLPDGARIRVDAFVDGRALARVLNALKRCP